MNKLHIYDLSLSRERMKKEREPLNTGCIINISDRVSVISRRSKFLLIENTEICFDLCMEVQTLIAFCALSPYYESPIMRKSDLIKGKLCICKYLYALIMK